MDFAKSQCILILPRLNLFCINSLNFGTVQVFYAYGRELKRTCPFPADSKMARNYLLSNVEEYKKLFPNLCLDLPAVSSMKVDVGTLKLSPHVFIVRNVRDGFRKDVNQKSRNNHSQ